MLVVLVPLDQTKDVIRRPGISTKATLMDAVHLSRDVELERVTVQTTLTACLVWCVERTIARKIKGLEVEQTAVNFFLMNSNQVKTCQQYSFMLLCD